VVESRNTIRPYFKFPTLERTALEAHHAGELPAGTNIVAILHDDSAIARTRQAISDRLPAAGRRRVRPGAG
jgi:hypothetical protein